MGLTVEDFDLKLLARGEQPDWLSMSEMPKRLAAEVIALRARLAALEAAACRLAEEFPVMPMMAVEHARDLNAAFAALRALLPPGGAT